MLFAFSRLVIVSSQTLVPAGAVSIPTRHAHRPGQVIDLGDLEAAAALLAATRIGPSGEAWYTPQD